MKVNLDSVELVNKIIDSSFTAEIDTLRNQKSTLLKDMDECVNLSVDLELENVSLIKDNKRLKKNNKKLAGATAGSVIILILTMLIVL